MPPLVGGALAFIAMAIGLGFLHLIEPMPMAAVPLLVITLIVSFLGGAVFLGTDDGDELPPGACL